MDFFSLTYHHNRIFYPGFYKAFSFRDINFHHCRVGLFRVFGRHLSFAKEMSFLHISTARPLPIFHVSLTPIQARNYKQMLDVFSPHFCSNSMYFPLQIKYNNLPSCKRGSHKYVSSAHAVISDVEDVGNSSQFEDFPDTTARIKESGDLKISIEVSGTTTREIFDDVFDKMVLAAQPIPGFRRVKGGKTPDIPRDILLEVLGPSRIYKEVIKKVINSTVADYVKKEGLKVGKNLRIEQSFEDLEEAFEPDEQFRFDAVIQLEEMN